MLDMLPKFFSNKKYSCNFTQQFENCFVVASNITISAFFFDSGFSIFEKQKYFGMGNPSDFFSFSRLDSCIFDGS